MLGISSLDAAQECNPAHQDVNELPVAQDGKELEHVVGELQLAGRILSRHLHRPRVMPDRRRRMENFGDAPNRRVGQQPTHGRSDYQCTMGGIAMKCLRSR